MSSPAVAIVTGAAGGIGAAVALRLAQGGLRLMITDVDEAGLRAVAAKVTPGQVLIAPGDLTETGFPVRLLETTLRECGSVDALVNCVGWLRDQRVENMPPELFRRLLEVNLIAPVRLMEAVLPHMGKQQFGRIVTLTSRAWLGTFGSSGYSAAKGGLVGVSRSLALAWAKYGVTVNCIAPGFIDTPMTRSMPPNIVERLIDAIPVGRSGTVDDISALVAYLIGRESGYITGQTIVSCGGRSITDPIAKKS